MGRDRIPLLLISGPVGVGKSSVGNELSEILLEIAVPHTFIDFDNLAATHPHPSGDRFGTRLALANLRDVWRNCAAAGSRNLIVAAVVEDREFVDDLARVVPGADVVVCQLRATTATLETRVCARELGSARTWHLERAVELARLLERAPVDLRVGTDDRSLRDIAAEVAGAVQWNGD